METGCKIRVQKMITEAIGTHIALYHSQTKPEPENPVDKYKIDIPATIAAATSIIEGAKYIHDIFFIGENTIKGELNADQTTSESTFRTTDRLTTEV